ncbi:hypothetical protein DNH61_23690 [Paenibacillus sambharensis]|uniref:Uncharacterized protein n=1 Tax=Paenibacillus sambharensis TaxID=1803190 RepID=A0A2W1LP65_9BACL|nr:hypothetical protein [Paenibacillus sambharensis]PZD93621.1 hypothetical protein DNH61_23690 [Paenibacillus sambharensis]
MDRFISGTPYDLIEHSDPHQQVDGNGRNFNIVRFLQRGPNSIIIIAFNFGGPHNHQNPAGVAARLDIRLSK